MLLHNLHHVHVWHVLCFTSIYTPCLTLVIKCTKAFMAPYHMADMGDKFMGNLCQFVQTTMQQWNKVSAASTGELDHFSSPYSSPTKTQMCPGGRFKNTYELLNLRALKYSPVNKIHIFQCMGEIFCVEFQRYPLKFHTKYLTHTLKDRIFIQHWNSKSS